MNARGSRRIDRVAIPDNIIDQMETLKRQVAELRRRTITPPSTTPTVRRTAEDGRVFQLQSIELRGRSHYFWSEVSE
jgi:hypothetical protein